MLRQISVATNCNEIMEFTQEQDLESGNEEMLAKHETFKLFFQYSHSLQLMLPRICFIYDFDDSKM